MVADPPHAVKTDEVTERLTRHYVHGLEQLGHRVILERISDHGRCVLGLPYVLPWRTLPSRIVVRTFANARTSCAGSPSSTTMSAASPGARRPVARPKRAAGAVVSIARICAGASPARCRYTNSSAGSDSVM